MAKLLSTKSNRLPSKAAPGDVFFVTDQKTFYVAIGDGSLINLADLLSGAVPHVRVVGPQGAPGLPGPQGLAGPQGERGEKGTTGHDGGQGPVGPKGADGLPGTAGKAGEDGRDGKDSVVPGPPGPKGNKGEKGDKGDISYIYVGAAEVEAAHKEIRAARARLLALIQDKLAGMGAHPAAQLARIHLEDVKREAEKLA